VEFTESGGIIIKNDETTVTIDEDGNYEIETANMEEETNDTITNGDDDDDDDDDDEEVDGDDDDDDDDDDEECLTATDMLCTADDTSEMGGTFDIICGLLESTGVDLTAMGAFTIFIPTDEAFQTMYAFLGTAGMEVDDATLMEIVLFHVHMGMVMSDDLVCGALLEMMAAGSSRTQCGNFDDRSGQIYFIQKGGGNRKNGIEPVIISPDHMTCEGSVIHVVDQVLLPNFIDALPSN